MSALLTKREKTNIIINIVISSLIFICGTGSLIVSAIRQPEQNFFLEFRFMTVNGTLFTTLISLSVIIISAVELRKRRELWSARLYHLRLSSAVTETIIAVVILMSFFPFVPDSPNIFTFESFNMHLVITPLSIVSFLLNKKPVTKMSSITRMNCAWLITLYAAVVITLIVLGLIPDEKIPYSFMDFKTRPVWYMIYFGCFIYSLTYVLSFLFTDWNHRISRFWTEENKAVSPQRS